jgi:GntR family transcriptional repressor for pyruvate dehydrogenase complex
MYDIIRMLSLVHGDGKLSDQIAGEFARRILKGELPAGTKLPTESELGTLLGVSRTVVRDAMRTLSVRGLVQVRHGHGMEVASSSEGAFADAFIVLLLRSNLTVAEVLEGRQVIEVGICPLAATRSIPADQERLETDLAAFAQAVQEGDWEAAHASHLAFHLDLLRATNVPAVEMMLRPMEHVVLLSSFPPQLDKPELWEVSFHQRILDALRARDEEETRQALVAHYTAMESDAYAECRTMLFRDSPGVNLTLTKAFTGRGGLSLFTSTDAPVRRSRV